MVCGVPPPTESALMEDGPAALIVARPRDLTPNRLRPSLQVCVLAAEPGLAALADKLVAAGAELGPVFGRFPEAGLCRALAAGDADRLSCLAEEVADAWLRFGAVQIIVPAWDEADPLACMARLVGDAAAARLHMSVPSARTFALGQNGELSPAAPFEARRILPRDLAALRIGLQEFAAGGRAAA